MSEAPGQRPSAPAPALVVRSAAEAAAALVLAGGQPVLLLSAPGAAGFLGAAGWQALLTATTAAAPHLPFEDALCCADAPGLALAALRAGCRGIVLDRACPAFAQVAAAATETGAALLPARPAALDLGEVDLGRAQGRRRLALWLAAAPHDSSPAPG